MSEQAEKEIKPPQPAKNYMPDWYKKLPPFHSGNRPRWDADTMSANATAKLCMPFFDTFITGYIQESWVDIIVEPDGSGDIIINQAKPELPVFRLRDHEKIYAGPEGYYSGHNYVWNTQWEPKTPKGWSTLYMHPMNQFELPFLTVNGVMDTDLWWQGGGLPFYIKDGFEGIIPKGTPMYQVVFIKRENWKSEFSRYDKDRQTRLDNIVRTRLHSAYKKHIWVKKNYD
jgi:hypothetical protein